MNLHYQSTIAIFFILLFSTFIPAASADEAPVLNVYYIEQRPNNSTWLVAYEPGDGEGNRTTIYTGSYLNLSQGVIDRAYNPDISPAIELFIDSHGVTGLVIEFYLEFRYFRESALPPDADVIADFESYTTIGRTDGPERIKLTSRSYTAEPQDIPQTDYGAIIKFSISVKGGDTGDSIDLYCGESGYRSSLTTPYDQPYIDPDIVENVSFKPCYIIAGISIGVLAVIIIILHIKDKNKGNK